MKISQYFEFEKLGTNFRTEILAGLSTFLSLAYIFVVSPSILSAGGMNPNAVLFATVVASALATISMGLWARLPFVLAPGLEMSAYVSFYLIAILGYSWQQSLTMVLLSGIVFLILTATKLRQSIIDSIPEKAKLHLAFAVGAFVFMIAWLVLDVVGYEKNVLSKFTPSFNLSLIATGLGLLVLIGLRIVRFPAAILVSILFSAFIFNIFGDSHPTPFSLGSDWNKGIWQFDWKVLSAGAVSAIFTLLVIDFYGSVAKFIGLTINTPINIREKSKNALWVDGAATVLGAGLGTTSVTTFVESAVGIGAGGRSGLTAIVCGVLMACTLLFAPLLQYIPVAATAPALLYVGYKLIPHQDILKTYHWIDWAVMIVIGLIIVFFFSLDRAMLLTFGVYFVVDLCRTKKANWILLGSTLVLGVAFCITLMQG